MNFQDVTQPDVEAREGALGPYLRALRARKLMAAVITLVAIVAAVQATMPARKTHTRAVPRSRMVARRARYSSCSRPVMVWVPPADKRVMDSVRWLAHCGSAHCGTGVVHGWAARVPGELFRGHNPLAFNELSGKLSASTLITLGLEKLK